MTHESPRARPSLAASSAVRRPIAARAHPDAGAVLALRPAHEWTSADLSALAG